MKLGNDIRVPLKGRRHAGCENPSLSYLKSALDRILREKRDVLRTYNVLATSLFSFCLASAGLVGCKSVNPQGAEETPTESASREGRSDSEAIGGEPDPVADSATATQTSTEPEADSESVPMEDTESEALMQSDTDVKTAETDSVSAMDTVLDAGPMPCDYETEQAESMRIAEAVAASDPCFNGHIWVAEDGTVYVSVSPRGSLSLRGPGVEERGKNAEKVVLDLNARCIGVRATVNDGGVNTEALDLWDRVVNDYCGDFELNEVVIDENGFVTDIVHPEWGDDHLDPEIVQCLMDVLDGLSFPCLADTFWSYVIPVR